MNNFIQSGSTVHYTNPSTAEKISSGDVVIIGTNFTGGGGLVGIASADAEPGKDVSVCLEGVYNLPKGSTALAVGVSVYWSTADGQVTTTATSNKRLGVVWSAAAAGDDTVEVRLQNR